jgi:class 3 adenylate cyclase/tetratricopeptide (TPR) repeat protein
MMRVVTFMSVDLVGSTEILARLGESRAQMARRGYAGILEAAAATVGGHLDMRGDGATVAFDSPSGAVSCAVAVQQACARHNARAADRLDARIGIQAGEAADDDDRHAEQQEEAGGPLLEAQRLCEAALGGQILVSSLVQTLAAPRCTCSFVPVGLLELRGVPTAIAASEVVFEQPARVQLPLPPELSFLPADRSAFVGRSAECARLRRAWARTDAGERQLALVAGEPGIGKSRLAAELALDVYDDGAVVLWGRCSEEALAPYQPFVQALRHYFANCDPDELQGAGAAHAAPLARLLPELALRVPVTERESDLETETGRYRLFAAIAALLAQIADEAPLLLVLDDLQWADQGTLQLLRMLLVDPRPAPMLVLGTFRDSEVPRTHPLAQLYADVLRDRAVDLVELDGLDETESAGLVRSLLGWTPPADVARALCGETEGNPFFLEEIVRHLAELGAVTDSGQLRRLCASVAELGVPRRVKELVARRVQRLSPGVVEALRVGSVLGAQFRLDELAAVLGETDARVVALLDQALDARLLVELPTRVGEYGFSHVLIQQALYDEQSANRRAALHARIAETLEAMRPHAAAELAHHFSLAGERSLAEVVAYGRAAGEQALELLAYEDAAHELARALAALGRARGDDLGERAELLVLLGSARGRAGETDAAERAFEEAATLAGTIGAATTLAHAALGYGGGTGFGGTWTKFARVDTVHVRFLEQALAAVPESDQLLRVQLLARLAQALYWGTEEEQERALALSEQALELAQPLGDSVALAHALDARHAALWEPENLEELKSLAEEMLHVGERIGDREIQLQAHAWLIVDVLESGPIDLLDRHLDAHASLAGELHQPYHLWFTEATRAMRAQLDGRFAETAEAIEAAWRHGQTAHRETAQAVYGVQLSQLEHETGRSAELLATLEQLAASSPLPAVKALLASAYADAGRESDALGQVEHFAGAEFTAIRRDCVWSSTACFLADVVARFDDRHHAAALYRLLLPYADRNCVGGGGVLTLGPVSRFLGMLARVNGEHERAVQHLRHALARSRALDSAPLVARTQLEKAKVLLARGREEDATRAHVLLGEVDEAAVELGMRPLVEEVAAVRSSAAATAVGVRA